MSYHVAISYQDYLALPIAVRNMMREELQEMIERTNESAEDDASMPRAARRGGI